MYVCMMDEEWLYKHIHAHTYIMCIHTHTMCPQCFLAPEVMSQTENNSKSDAIIAIPEPSDEMDEVDVKRGVTVAIPEPESAATAHV